MGDRTNAGDAGQFFNTIDEHATGATGGMMAGVSKSQAAILESPDAFDDIQDIILRVDFNGKRLVMPGAVCFLTRDE